MVIHHLSYPIDDYNKAINNADSPTSLVAAIEPFKLIANDALIAAKEMKEDDFKSFRVGLMQERRGTFAGEEWASKYIPIIMPEIMLVVAAAAQHFHAPWGTAYLQMCSAGEIIVEDGVAKRKK